MAVIQQKEKHVAASYLLVRVVAAYCACLVTYFIISPGGGTSGTIQYFLVTAGIAIPVALSVTDVTRGLTAQAIITRCAAALASGITYVLLMMYTGAIFLVFAGPLFAAAVSDLVLRDDKRML